MLMILVLKSVIQFWIIVSSGFSSVVTATVDGSPATVVSVVVVILLVTVALYVGVVVSCSLTAVVVAFPSDVVADSVVVFGFVAVVAVVAFSSVVSLDVSVVVVVSLISVGVIVVVVVPSVDGTTVVVRVSPTEGSVNDWLLANHVYVPFMYL